MSLPTHLLPPVEPSQVSRLAHSPGEVAAALGLSRARVYQLMDDGTIPSLKLGRRRLIRHDSLVAVLAKLETAGEHVTPEVDEASDADVQRALAACAARGLPTPDADTVAAILRATREQVSA